jgi:Short C-terminal domain
MFGPSRRVARRTARRTARRQSLFYGGDDYDDEPAPPPAAAPAQPDYAVELQKLADLKAAGVIDDQEFDAKKKQILGI